MSKKIIAVDIDDVLAASAEGFVSFINERWGTNLTVDTYDEHWGRMWGIDQKETLKRAQIIYGSNIVHRFRRFNEADEILKKLAKNYTLVAATSRNRLVKKDTLAWIDCHYKGIFKEVHMTGFYDGPKEDSHKLTKAELLQSIGADYLIDDHPKHCFAAAQAGITALLFGDYAWNRNVKKLPERVVRVKNWHEVEEYFKHATS